MQQSNTPKISIIIPVYNAEKYLEECLDSLVKQSYKNIEILCINDGSKDSSWEILNEYAKKDERILVFSQENSGPAMARNVGLANANGEYLMFCDADDSYEPTMCEEMINVIHQSDYDFVMCDTNIIETDKKTRPSGVIAYNNLNIFNDYELNSDNKGTVRTLLWNKIFRMELIRKFDIVFPIGFEMDDDAFIYQYLSVSQKAFGLPKKLYNYRLVDTSIVANYYNGGSEKLFDAIFAYEFVVSQLIKNNIFENNKKWLINQINNKIYWIMELLYKDKALKFLYLVENKILRHFLKEDLLLYEALTLIKNKKYKEAYYFFNNVDYKSYLNLLKIKKTESKETISFLGIEVFKKKKNSTREKYYLFGIKYREKEKFDVRRIMNSLADIKGYMRFLSNDINNITSRLISTAFLHQKTFKGYKNKYQNQDIVLVGAGPTVNNFKKINNLIYVGLNRAFLRKDIDFNYLFASDKIGIEKFVPELIEYAKKTTLFIGDINCGKDFQLPESIILKLNARRYNTNNISTSYNHSFALDIETQPLGAFHSVAFQAMQFILYTNPKRIYLVGIDCGNAGKHFGGVEHDVASRGEDIENLQQIQINEWKQLKEFADIYYPETEIISVNPVGLRYLFNDVYTKEYLSEHSEINPTKVKLLEDI